MFLYPLLFYISIIHASCPVYHYSNVSYVILVSVSVPVTLQFVISTFLRRNSFGFSYIFFSHILLTIPYCFDLKNSSFETFLFHSYSFLVVSYPLFALLFFSQIDLVRQRRVRPQIFVISISYAADKFMRRDATADPVYP